MKTIAKYFPALSYFNVPNVITTTGLILGIAACYYLVAQNFRAAVVCLFFAAICDLVDGYFANKLNQQSRFGQAIDSLVDFFTCVIMPVWIVHGFMGDNWPLRIGLVFYCMCGLWRLAYYNINEADKSFTGLPVPSAMMLVTMATWAIVYMNFPEWALTITFFVTGLLMLSYFKLRKYGKWQVIMAGIGLAFFIMVLITWLAL
ncbi:MAG: CDP-alcohol phosphatidyltransferase family protein [Defluviitaleaceae bacterium]|nr:CDP-alcohol phosphatidyltransferase family protein [Defluviitaleaceae bacterium]